MSRRWRWIAGILAAIVVIVVAASFAADEPIRREIEHQMNRKLKGYTARVHRVSFHPFDLSITLFDLVWSQDAHPDPPIFRVPRLDASVQWNAILFGRGVANFQLDRPQVYADRTHAEAEAKDPTPLTQHGWQLAFEAIYPLKINHIRVNDGRITSVDRGQAKPSADRRAAPRQRRHRDRKPGGTVRVHAKFMGSGDTTATIAFRPERQGPNFDLDLKVEHTDLTALNDLLRAYGKFDGASGTLSVYSEMKVHNGRVDGYVKPLFHDVKVSSPETAGDKTFGQKVREKLIGTAFKILKNHPRQQVATQTDISGPLQNPRADRWQILVGLLRNAFFRAILPGLHRTVAAERGGKPPAAETAGTKPQRPPG